MLKERRHLDILRFLNKEENSKNGVRISELANLYNVSLSTIRRDLNELEKSEVVKRIHGGVILQKPIKEEYDFESKTLENLDIKNKIAKYAALQVKDGDVIAINSSTITYLIVKYLNDKKVKIVTNSVALLNEVNNSTNLEFVVLGGIYIKDAKTIEGSETVDQIKNMYFDKCFIGANGIDIKKGVTTAGPIEVYSKIEMMKNSKEKFLLCESSKFQKNSFYKFSEIKDFTYIITDHLLNEKIYERYNKSDNIIKLK